MAYLFIFLIFGLPIMVVSWYMVRALKLEIQERERIKAKHKPKLTFYVSKRIFEL